MVRETLPPNVEMAFHDQDRQTRIQNSKVGCWLAIALMPAGILLDYFVYPSQLWFFLQLRLFCSLLVFGVWVVFHTSVGVRFYRFWGMVWYLLPAFFITWMIYTTEGAASPYYAGLNIVLLAVGSMLPWTSFENLLAGSLIMVMYLGACLLRGPIPFSGPQGFFNNLYFLVLTDVIVVTGSYFSERLRRREFALRFELDLNRKTLEENNRKLVELDLAKGRFFANISHELRTPLTLLIAPLESLRENPATAGEPGGRDLLDTMEQNALRLLKLINDLLDLVRLEEGRLPLRWDKTDLAEFLNGMAHTVSRAAAERRIDLRTQVAYDLGERWIDRDKLERIVLNLLFNSLKFTPAGGRITLSAELEGERLTVRVADTGIGISEANRAHVFDRFWQADDTSRRKHGGTGIGLALVREMAETQGGFAAVESREGHGSTFTIEVPASVEAPEGTESPSPYPKVENPPGEPEPDWINRLYRRAELFPSLGPRTRSAAREETSPSTGKSRILVVDDEPDMRRFLKSQLSTRFEVLEAVDGQQGLDKARQFHPDLVLLDMMMPEKDGLQVLAELREEGPMRTVPVILLTARADEDTKVKALTAGADDFLTKPFSVTELHLRVQNLVNARELSKTLTRQNQRLTDTLERLQDAESQLVQSEKLNALGQLSAGLIHEINNPLNYALSAVHLLGRVEGRLVEAERAAYAEQLADVKDGLLRVSRLVTDLKGFSHKHAGSLERIALEPCVRTAFRFFAHQIDGTSGVTLEIPVGLEVVGNANQVVQVLVNLIQNALDAYKPPPSGESLHLTATAREEAGRVQLDLADNGPGIPEEIQGHIFEPFFTTKDVGAGLGLGLSICHRLMAGMQGRIGLTSTPGHGARFTLDWPAPDAVGAQEGKHASTL